MEVLLLVAVDCALKRSFLVDAEIFFLTASPAGGYFCRPGAEADLTGGGVEGVVVATIASRYFLR